MASGSKFSTFSLDKLECIEVPSDPNLKTCIPFGINGVTAVITPYGEILRLSQYRSEGRRLTSLSSAYLDWQWEFHEFSHLPTSGIGLYLQPTASREKLEIRPRLQWVNDRWPRITFSVDGIDITVQFTIRNGVLCQQYVLANNSDQPKDIPLHFEYRNSKIRTQRAGDGRWDWEFSDDHRDIKHIHGGKLALLSEWDEGISKQESETAASINLQRERAHTAEAAICVFDSGHAVNLEETPPSLFSTQDFSRSVRKEEISVPPLNIGANQSHEIVIQYKLGVAGQSGISLPPAMDFLDTNLFLKEDLPGYSPMAAEDKLNVMFRRHLEHTLCVGAVSVAEGMDSEETIAFNYDYTHYLPSTSGIDFDTFLYLLLVYEHIQEHVGEGVPHKSAWIERIRKTCKGHLRWCFQKSIFLSDVTWPRPVSSVSDEPGENNLRSTLPRKQHNGADNKYFTGSMRFIMLYEYAKAFTLDKDFVKTCLQDCGKLWLDALSDTRGRKSRLWYSNTVPAYITWEGLPENGSEWLNLPDYRLGDHCFLWKALHAIEWLAENSQDDNDTRESILSALKESHLRHDDIHEDILQRFVCAETGANARSTGNPEETPVKPAIEPGSFFVAVSRSRARDRKLLHASDSTIYEGLRWGFIHKGCKVTLRDKSNDPVDVDVEEAWFQTVQAQEKDHEDIWDSALRYATAMSMRHHTHVPSTKRTVEEFTEVCINAILKGILPTGLLHHEIHWETKLPVMDYFPIKHHTSWEVACLVFRNKYPHLEERLFHSPDTMPTREHGILEVKKVSKLDRDTTFTKSELLASSQPQERLLALRKQVRIEKRRWLGHKTFNESHINDLAERKTRDWLFPMPDFISPDKPYILENEIRGLSTKLEELEREDAEEDDLELWRRGVKKWKDNNDAFDICNWSAMVVDIRHRRRDEPVIRSLDAEDLDEHLSKVRTETVAKKRFLYLRPLEVEHALIIYLSSPENERANMLKFILQHQKFEAKLHEDIHSLADSWITEFHLSFTRIIPIAKDLYEDEEYGKTESDEICNSFQRKFANLIPNTYHALSTASLSYRFVGDAGDRYWTGTFLGYLPGESKNIETPRQIADSRNKAWFVEAARHDQRKVLEPYIVGKMTAEAYQSTEYVLQVIETWLDPEQGPLKGNRPKTKKNKPGEDEQQDRDGPEDDSTQSAGVLNEMRDFESLYNRSTLCMDINIMLNNVHRLSKANKDCLERWISREKSRGNEKPRWTKKDETRCGDLVDHQERQVRQNYGLLCHQYEKIQSLLDRVKDHRQFLVDRLQLYESRTAAYNAENVRIFTYATVIFLPLSFVSSLFSMQSLPPSNTVNLFLQSVAVALLVTLLLVFNAEALAWLIRVLRYTITQSARKRMKSTSNMWPVKWKQTFLHIIEAEKHDILLDNSRPEAPRSKLVYFFFLVIYMIVEFPATRIISAWNLLQHIEVKNPAQLLMALFQVLVAILLLPVFLAVWIFITLWENIAYVIFETVQLPSLGLKELANRSEKELKEQARKEVKEAIENDRQEKKNKKEEEQKKVSKDTKDRGDENRRDSNESERPEGPTRNIEQPARQVDFEELVAEKVRKKRLEKDERLQEGVEKLITSHPNLMLGRFGKSGQDNKANVEERSALTSDVRTFLGNKEGSNGQLGQRSTTLPVARQPWWRRLALLFAQRAAKAQQPPESDPESGVVSPGTLK